MGFFGKHGPLLIAEIGGNHEGDFEYAKALTQKAIETNVDYIKFQIYTGDTLVSKIEGAQRNAHFKKFELLPKQHIELAKMVRKAGIGYMASVWDMNAIEWIDEYMPIYKIGSGDMTAYPVIEQIANLGKPIILSTGLSDEKEVLDTIAFIQESNPLYKEPEYLAILQCTSMYPIDFTDANLNVMTSLAQKTALTVGYSDHTMGSKAMQYAYAMGAQILEFHFTDTREGKEFRDHKVSLTPAEVLDLIDEIRTINDLKGDSLKKPLEIEREAGHTVSFRRALYPSRDLNKGHIITKEDLVPLRPLHGVDAREYDKLIGKKLTNSKKQFERIDLNDFK
jgi:N,N'-diacetyllegionaminate synthase